MHPRAVGLVIAALLLAAPIAQAAPDVIKRELIRESARISDLGQAAARDALLRAFTEPVTESQVVEALSRAMVENGSSEYVAGFEAIVASGPASAIPHGEPTDDDSNYILPGEVVVVDIGARYKGWVSDNTKTYFIGSDPPATFLEIYAIVKEAQSRAVAAIRSGLAARDLDAVGRSYIDEQGYGDAFVHCLGHGVGLYVHVPPLICPDSDDYLITARNDVVAIEPGIYLDGCFGVRIEDDFAVLRTGAERYTFASADLQDILLAPPADWNGTPPTGEFADFSGCPFAVDAKAAAGGPSSPRAPPPPSSAAALLGAAAAALVGAIVVRRHTPELFRRVRLQPHVWVRRLARR